MSRRAASAKADAAPADTPMMAQYLAIKEAHPNALLFYRMGDFYELFFKDAEIAAAALDIALTSRGRHRGEDIPMCGVPANSHEAYLQRLIAQGFRVAVCEQTEAPAEAKKRGAKSVVAREVMRIITAGTLTEDGLLDARRHNYLAAVARAGAGAQMALAWIDVSTGDLAVKPTDDAGLWSDLARVFPRELLISEREWSAGLVAKTADEGATLTALDHALFDSTAGERRLRALFQVGSLDAFGQFSRAELGALGAVIAYVELTQKGRLPRIKPPRHERAGEVMGVDGATRRNLEIERSLSGERKGGLLHAIDRTVTGGGARLLGERLAAPSTDPQTINARADALDFFLEAGTLRAEAREILARVPDIERALQRLSLGRAGPRDLGALRDGLMRAGELEGALASARPALAPPPDQLIAARARLRGHDALLARLQAALAETLPTFTRDGGFIAQGFEAELDELRALSADARKVILSLEARLREETGVASLKIKHNNVLGFHVDVTAAQGPKLMAPPHDAVFIHRQTLANNMRFTTLELKELETRIADASERALDIERRLFDALSAEILEASAAIAETAAAIAEIDLAAAGAELSAAADWRRAQVDASRAFKIEGGRHPVVERAIAQSGDGVFAPNDCDISGPEAGGARLWLLTGPNMGGKSTFLRQNALIAILAQAGLHVPARAAHIGVVDRLFSRVGASDDLARGRSTFMVEMVETAAILNQAGPRALVILDEIGRGTATYDGMSIAWASLEHLHEANRCRGLFATHFHELTALATRLSGLTNAHVTAREWKGEVVFLHEVAEGVADRSYGVQVARLAGLPQSVVERARHVLADLERRAQTAARGRKRGGGAGPLETLPLFAAPPSPPPPPPSPALEALREVDADALSPRAALDLVYRLKKLASEDKPR